jgi:hypothetical protein
MRFTGTPEPRVLLSIDYEPWAVLLQREYNTAPSATRRQVDDGYTAETLDDVLDVLAGVSASVYLIGEIVDWHPEVAGKIVAAGHELGFHGHVHRPLVNGADLRQDLRQSRAWLQQFDVRGYRAPMVNISYQAYPALAEAGLSYSSSVYAPSGCLQRVAGVWEIPVSTWPLWGRKPAWWWPRRLSARLLAQGEFPYGSSFFIGVMGERIFPWIERDLRQGRSPVLVFHNYQIAPPSGWPGQIGALLRRDPVWAAFVPSRRTMLARLVREFPVGTVGGWLDGQADE